MTSISLVDSALGLGLGLGLRGADVFAANDALSDVILILSGVPQGTVPGTLLFWVALSDDTIVPQGIKDPTHILRLQNNLDTKYKWADENNMQFNGAKFQALRSLPPKKNYC